MNKGKFYSAKNNEHRYSAAMQQCIEKTYAYCEQSASSISSNNPVKPIMMLGKIQSGKTRAFTGVIALAFDNFFDMVIILTKNSSALAKQTYKRMRDEFRAESSKNEIHVYDIMNVFERRLTSYELDKKMIVVAKKETNNLDKITSFISNYKIAGRKYCLIIDDEADTTSIGFSKVKGAYNEFDLRTIAAKVNAFRGSLQGYAFLQVTATPYALYLQPDFNEKEIESVRPQQTVLVPSGDDYVGGEYYFLESKVKDHPAQFIFEEVTPGELAIVTSVHGDRRRFKEEDILTSKDKLRVFKKGIMNFMVGGCILRMTNPNEHYSYVIHTNTQKSSHLRLEGITEIFREQLVNRNEVTTPIIENLLSTAYEDIKKSRLAYGHGIPSFENVREAFYNAIDKDHLSVTVVNSDKDIDSYL